jgi:hypothetical protein
MANKATLVSLLEGKPITQSVVGSGIAQVIWQGVSFAISFVAGHSAYIEGLPLYLAILLGAVIFLILAIVANVLSAIIFRRTHSREALSGETLSAIKATAEIGILTPNDNDEVGLQHVVRGYVSPPGTPIQVLVYSRNRKWYLQRSVDVSGYGWSVECVFGNDKTPDGSIYKVIALLGDHLKTEKYDNLPDATAKSNIVTIRRRSPNPPKLASEDYARFLYTEMRVDVRQLAQGYIRFSFLVFNGARSLLLAEKNIDGFISYEHPDSHETVRLERPLVQTQSDDTEPGKYTAITLRQQVLPEIVQQIMDTLDAGKPIVFSLSDLTIKLRFSDDVRVVLPLYEGISCTNGIAVGRIVSGSMGGTLPMIGTLH